MVGVKVGFEASDYRDRSSHEVNRDLIDSNLKKCISLNHQMLDGSSCFRKVQTQHFVIPHCQRFKMPNSTDPEDLTLILPAPRHP